ncbi:PREDICTED: odorant receptor 13a-like [Eufriesea mexicana]|uniref:odorant receptor 13a-like n=1 Tax=Eufriesea mexicana TaxID=516756 RepID=UPI00083BACE7|nr:PREDICTED: odorant receptor 13a-like [Eufriesea mexicana]XP_017753432.1 PREDICTED: odorant receptor 13a-like [Eufriesea mexicana]
MDWEAIEYQYLGDNRFFGRLVGVWPNQEKYLKYFLRSFVLLTMILSFTTQIARIVKFFDKNVLADQVMYLTIGCALLIKQYNYILNEDKLRELLHNIVSDRLMDRPEDEVAILEMYGKRALVLSFFYKVTLIGCGSMFILIPAIPSVLNIVVPLNESRSRELIYPSYYFVDEQRYYYPKLVHMELVTVIFITMFIACDTHLIHIVHHGCALSYISGYRFKHALDDFDPANQNAERIDRAYAKVRRSVEAHKSAVDYVDKIEACHTNYFLIMIASIVTVFTLTFVMVATMEFGPRFFIYCICIMGQMIHLLFLTILGQFVINTNDETFLTICENCWYKGVPRTRLLYVLVLRKCLDPPILTGGKMVYLNLETFVQVMKVSFSYYTMLRST